MHLSELRALKPKIMEIAAQYGVRNISVFGSVARGDADENSDVDLFIDHFEGSLLRFAGLKTQMEDVLGVPVDIRQRQHILNPRVWSRIEKELVSL